MPRLASVGPRLGASTLRLASKPDAKATGARRAKGPNNTAAWQKLRLEILRRDAVSIKDHPHLMPSHVLFPDDPWLWPRCRTTGEFLVGKHPAPNSPVADHIIPHRGDLALFWDPDNIQTVSKRWHDSQKQSLEKSGLA
jgi:5-methylcytosine-specific restriction endonuclease McrA